METLSSSNGVVVVALSVCAIIASGCDKSAADAEPTPRSAFQSMAQDDGGGSTPSGDNRLTDVEMEVLRKRAWSLFLEVQAAGLPNPMHWFHATDAFGPECKHIGGAKPWTVQLAAERDSLEEQLQRQAQEQPSLAFNEVVASNDERPLYESTFFNQQACDDIHNKDYPLNDFGTTHKLLLRQRREIDEFHLGAKVIKAFWRPLPADGSAINVGIWQWGYGEEQSLEAQWPLSECVQKEPPAGSACLRAEDFFPIVKVVNPADFPCANRCPQGVQHGQELILLGVHVISKESPDWLWATFWWRGGTRYPRTAGKAWTCDGAQQPDELDGVWRNYSTNVTKSFKSARPEVLGDDAINCGVPTKIGSVHEEYLATYNPFVEGVLERGRKSSCIVCHARASTRDSSAQPFRIPAVGVIEWPPVTEFEGHIRTDYLWSVRGHLASTED